MKTYEIQSSQGKYQTLFIPAAVDDYGLTPPQFRVLCAIARRGECFESAASLAKRCRVKRKTLWRALGALLQVKAIQRETRLGRTSIYRVRPIGQWQSPSCQREVSLSEPHGQKETTTRSPMATTTPPQRDTTEGTPTKVLPLRYSPAQGNDPLFLSTWEKWMEYRRGLRNKPKNIEAMFAEQLAWLAGFPNATAIEIMNQSLRNGWQGLFPPKGGAPHIARATRCMPTTPKAFEGLAIKQSHAHFSGTLGPNAALYGCP